LTKPFDLAEDEVGIRLPHKRLGIFVAVIQVGEHRFLQRTNGRVAATADTSFGYLREQPFYQVEPASAGRREVYVVAWMPRQPSSNLADLVGPLIIHHQVNVESLRQIGIDLVEKL
jgi:hypothetical protein